MDLENGREGGEDGGVPCEQPVVVGDRSGHEALLAPEASEVAEAAEASPVIRRVSGRVSVVMQCTQ